MSLSGALTPAGLGCSSIVPLIKAGFVDWIVATGANLYHDLHFALNYPVRAGSFTFDDTELRENDIVRVYDVLLGYSDCLMATDEILRDILVQPEFQKEMGTAELHHLLGRYAAEWERKAGLKDVSVLAAAYRAGVPCYTSSPGDSTIGMNVAGVELRGNKLRLNPSIDVNETTAFVLAAKRSGGKSAVVLWGGGSPKNFMLQTEPQIQEVLRIKEYGQDYFFQVTDARPDTGGLSGATPSEAVSWGKVDPDRLPDAVVCYTDTTIAMPLLTHYALARHKPRKLRRLYDKRGPLMKALTREYFKYNKVKMLDGTRPGLLSGGPRMNRSELARIARKHGTPVVVIDHDVIRRNYASFRRHLPKVQAYYAVKANPAPEIVRTLYRAGASFDVASLPEFMLVYENIKRLAARARQDFIWDKIIYANPIKPWETLEALDRYRPLVTYDNRAELAKIKAHAPHAGVVLRLRVPNTGSMVELSSKFGCDPGEAADLIDEAFRIGLVVEGLSFHVGSQCTNFENFVQALNMAAAVAERGARAAATTSRSSTSAAASPSPTTATSSPSAPWRA